MQPLFGKTFNMLGTMLDYRSERNKHIASNIANLDTPDYQPTDLVFKDDLKNATDARIKLTQTHKKHFPNAGDEISRNQFKQVTSEEKVDLDREMSNLAENHLMFNLTAELLARKFRGIRNVLTEAK
jgi:flagellar basal-body rod protein FlgB